MENRREYIEKLAARINELETEIRELEELAEKAIAEVKSDYNLQINDLFLKKEEINEKISKIQKASGNAWEDMKAGAELSWEVFNDAVKKQSEQ